MLAFPNSKTLIEVQKANYLLTLIFKNIFGLIFTAIVSFSFHTPHETEVDQYSLGWNISKSFKFSFLILSAKYCYHISCTCTEHGLWIGSRVIYSYNTKLLTHVHRKHSVPIYARCTIFYYLTYSGRCNYLKNEWLMNAPLVYSWTVTDLITWALKDNNISMEQVMSSRAYYSWWRHQMDTFSALLAFWAGNSPVAGEFPAQRPVTRSFDVSFDLCLSKQLSKLSWGWWFETLSRPLRCHCNVYGKC